MYGQYSSFNVFGRTGRGSAAAEQHPGVFPLKTFSASFTYVPLRTQEGYIRKMSLTEHAQRDYESERQKVNAY